jgi:hypothetical protein
MRGPWVRLSGCLAGVRAPGKQGQSCVSGETLILLTAR